MSRVAKVSWALLVVALLASSLVAPASAAKKKKKKQARIERTVTVAYEGTNQVGVNSPAGYVGYVSIAEYIIPTEKKEKYLSLTIEDATGLDVVAVIGYQGGGPSDGEWICGATDRPISVTPESALQIYLWHGTCNSGEPTAVTSGVITATLSNLP